MRKASQVMVRLLGTFAVDTQAPRPIAISVRSRKARALIAYLAMKRDYRATREELATLLWGDNPDALARQSLRQCLISLRQDLSVAASILTADRDVIALRPSVVSVDARAFLALARSADPIERGHAAELWRGPFLPDHALDIEEFDLWHRQEADRLQAAAAGVLDTLARQADASGHGERAIAFAEQLVALEPTDETHQRAVLKLIARYLGREAALSRAKLLTDLLRRELNVAPEAATRTLVEAIRRGDFDASPACAPDLPASSAAPVTIPVAQAGRAPTASEPEPESASSVARLPHHEAAAAKCSVWLRRGLSAASIAIALAATSAVAVGLATSVPGPWRLADLAIVRILLPQQTTTDEAKATRKSAPRRLMVMPFAADGAGPADDLGFARSLTHDVIGYLTRFGNLRVISEQVSEPFRDRPMDPTQLANDLGVRYALVGHVQDTDGGLRVDLQLVDTVTRTNVWADRFDRQRGNVATLADDAARGIARAVSIEIGRVGALAHRNQPSAQLSANDLVQRGYWAMRNGAVRENLVEALGLFKEALQRDPRYQPAQLALSRARIVAASNFVDLDPRADPKADPRAELEEVERMLGDVLRTSPNSVSGHYSIAILNKYRRQYQASLRSLQRCLELNPSFLPAQAQIANILTRTGDPQQGLTKILKTIGSASQNDPAIGYWYLFAAEAELELGHDRAALDWALRANTVMPGTPLVHAWLASIYTSLGDTPAAAQHVASLMKMAPGSMQRFIDRPNARVAEGRNLRIFEGLRLALKASLG